MKKITSVFFICIIICFNLSSCDWTIYPEHGYYVCEEPFFEFYYNVDYDTPGNSRLEYNEMMVDADFLFRGNTGIVDLVDSKSTNDETLYIVEWELDSEGNIILDRYTPSKKYYDTITLERQELNLE